jgi:hypothetical protein
VLTPVGRFGPLRLLHIALGLCSVRRETSTRIAALSLLYEKRPQRIFRLILSSREPSLDHNDSIAQVDTCAAPTDATICLPIELSNAKLVHAGMRHAEDTSLGGTLLSSVQKTTGRYSHESCPDDCRPFLCLRDRLGASWWEPARLVEMCDKVSGNASSPLVMIAICI